MPADIEQFTAYVRAHGVRSRCAGSSTRAGGRGGANAWSTLPEPVEAPLDPADATAVRAALARVPARQGATIVPRYYESYDVAGTARLLGCSTGTAKSQTARGLATLRTLLGEFEPAAAEQPR